MSHDVKAVTDTIKAVTDTVTPCVTPQHSPREMGRLCRQGRAQGRHFRRADIYTEDMPRSCSDINHDWGNTQPRPAKLTQTGHGKRLRRCEKKVIVCIYSCSAFSFLQPSPLEGSSVLTQISCHWTHCQEEHNMERAFFQVLLSCDIQLSWKAGKALPLLLISCAML